ncbi:MAG: hypothetical protein A2V70_15755 [Planctomycetes bacterium RBG_13_63_9]|nr:MAG: hypothetical protein A2V70_15755 [Planctomycetes bacterium RBG_13_63_9]
MLRCNRSWIMLVVTCLVAACLGCRRNEKPVTVPNDSGGQPNVDATQSTTPKTHAEPTESVDTAAPPVPLPETIPQVRMTDELAATCKVGVGDAMPDGKLRDLEDNEHLLTELFGEKLTVVCFWTSQNAYATAELADLTPDVAEPYFEKGLRVIGINEGDSPEVAAQKVQDAGVKYPVLVDPGGLYFANVATERLPRTYVLDPDGKILWFDTEYSGISRDQLLRTIRVVLGEAPSPQPKSPSPEEEPK